MTISSYLSGHVVDGVVYLNADQVALALRKLGLNKAAGGFEEAAQKIRKQAE